MAGIKSRKVLLPEYPIRILTTPFLVVVGILAVLYIFSRSMAMMPQGVDTDVMKEIAGVANTATAMIGTLVGLVVGHTAGSAGKEKADERAMVAMEQEMKAEKKVAALSGMDPDMMETAKQKLPDLFS